MWAHKQLGQLPLSGVAAGSAERRSQHFPPIPWHVAQGTENIGRGSLRLKLAEHLQLPSKQKWPWHFPQLDLVFLCSWWPSIWSTHSAEPQGFFLCLPACLLCYLALGFLFDLTWLQWGSNGGMPVPLWHVRSLGTFRVTMVHKQNGKLLQDWNLGEEGSEWWKAAHFS